MSKPLGTEFSAVGAVSEELQRRLAYLAAQDTKSVQTGGFKSARTVAHRQKDREDDGVLDTIQLLAAQAQAREARIREIDDRLDALDRASAKALHEAQERLEQTRANANRARDGRIVFQDKDGTIYDEHDNKVSPDEIDRNSWDANAPSYSQFCDDRNRTFAAAQYRKRVLEAKDKPGNDPSDNDLADKDSEVEQLEQSMPDGVARHYVPPQVERTAAADANAGRRTSAAKIYEDDPDARAGVALNSPFTGAALGDAPHADTPEGPATVPAPHKTFTAD